MRTSPNVQLSANAVYDAFLGLFFRGEVSMKAWSSPILKSTKLTGEECREATTSPEALVAVYRKLKGEGRV